MIRYYLPSKLGKPWFILAGSACGIMVLSLLRFVFHGLLTTQDVGETSDWTSWLACFGLLVLLGFFGYAYYRVVMNYEGWVMNRREVTALSLALILIATPMLPMLSGDIFSVFAYADLALKGISPYIDGNNLRYSDFFNYLTPVWRDAPCIYGPVSLAIAAVPVAIGGTANLVLSIFIFKAIGAVSCVIFILIISRLRVNENSQFNVYALVLLSPIFWLQGAGQAHLDIMAVSMIAAALFFAKKEHFPLSALLAALAFNVKITTAIICPLLVLLLWNSYRQKIGLFLIIAMECMAIFAITTILVWIPLYAGPQTLAEPWRFLSHIGYIGGPVKFIVSRVLAVVAMLPDILAAVNQSTVGWSSIFSSIMAGDWALTWATKKLLIVQYDYILKMILTTLFLIIVAFNAWKYIWKASSSDAYVKFFAIAGTAYFTLSGIVFRPWYMLIVLTFYLYLNDRVWVVWAIFAGVLIHCLDLSNFIHKGGTFAVLYIFAFVVMLVLFFWKIRARYFA